MPSLRSGCPVEEGQVISVASEKVEMTRVGGAVVSLVERESNTMEERDDGGSCPEMDSRAEDDGVGGGGWRWSGVGCSGDRKVKVRELGSLITCGLCGGYLIDATTIIRCMHSYCRSCIVRYLRLNHYCPECTKASAVNPGVTSISDLRDDVRLQTIVYKIVPGLLEKELQRRETFYESAFQMTPAPGNLTTSATTTQFTVGHHLLQPRGCHKLHVHANTLQSPGHPELTSFAASSSEDWRLSMKRYYGAIYQGTENINVLFRHVDRFPPFLRPRITVDNLSNRNQTPSEKDQLDNNSTYDTLQPSRPNNGPNGSCYEKEAGLVNKPTTTKKTSVSERRYLLCPIQLTVALLKKYIIAKYQLQPSSQIAIFFADQHLFDDLTLLDVAYIFRWKKVTRLKLRYLIIIEPTYDPDSLWLALEENYSSDWYPRFEESLDIRSKHLCHSTTTPRKRRCIQSGNHSEKRLGVKKIQKLKSLEYKTCGVHVGGEQKLVLEIEQQLVKGDSDVNVDEEYDVQDDLTCLTNGEADYVTEENSDIAATLQMNTMEGNCIIGLPPDTSVSCDVLSQLLLIDSIVSFNNTAPGYVPGGTFNDQSWTELCLAEKYIQCTALRSNASDQHSLATEVCSLKPCILPDNDAYTDEKEIDREIQLIAADVAADDHHDDDEDVEDADDTNSLCTVAEFCETARFEYDDEHEPIDISEGTGCIEEDANGDDDAGHSENNIGQDVVVKTVATTGDNVAKNVRLSDPKIMVVFPHKDAHQHASCQTPCSPSSMLPNVFVPISPDRPYNDDGIGLSFEWRKAFETAEPTLEARGRGCQENVITNINSRTIYTKLDSDTKMACKPQEFSNCYNSSAEDFSPNTSVESQLCRESSFKSIVNRSQMLAKQRNPVEFNDINGLDSSHGIAADTIALSSIALSSKPSSTAIIEPAASSQYLPDDHYSSSSGERLISDSQESVSNIPSSFMMHHLEHPSVNSSVAVSWPSQSSDPTFGHQKQPSDETKASKSIPNSVHEQALVINVEQNMINLQQGEDKEMHDGSTPLETACSKMKIMAEVMPSCSFENHMFASTSTDKTEGSRSCTKTISTTSSLSKIIGMRAKDGHAKATRHRVSPLWIDKAKTNRTQNVALQATQQVGLTARNTRFDSSEKSDGTLCMKEITDSRSCCSALGEMTSSEIQDESVSTSNSTDSNTTKLFQKLTVNKKQLSKVLLKAGVPSVVTLNKAETSGTAYLGNLRENDILASTQTAGSRNASEKASVATQTNIDLVGRYFRRNTNNQAPGPSYLSPNKCVKRRCSASVGKKDKSMKESVKSSTSICSVHDSEYPAVLPKMTNCISHQKYRRFSSPSLPVKQGVPHQQAQVLQVSSKKITSPLTILIPRTNAGSFGSAKPMFVPPASLPNTPHLIRLNGGKTALIITLQPTTLSGKTQKLGVTDQHILLSSASRSGDTTTSSHLNDNFCLSSNLTIPASYHISSAKMMPTGSPTQNPLPWLNTTQHTIPTAAMIGSVGPPRAEPKTLFMNALPYPQSGTMCTMQHPVIQTSPGIPLSTSDSNANVKQATIFPTVGAPQLFLFPTISQASKFTSVALPGFSIVSTETAARSNTQFIPSSLCTQSTSLQTEKLQQQEEAFIQRPPQQVDTSISKISSCHQLVTPMNWQITTRHLESSSMLSRPLDVQAILSEPVFTSNSLTCPSASQIQDLVIRMSCSSLPHSLTPSLTPALMQNQGSLRTTRLNSASCIQNCLSCENEEKSRQVPLAHFPQIRTSTNGTLSLGVVTHASSQPNSLMRAILEKNDVAGAVYEKNQDAQRLTKSHPTITARLSMPNSPQVQHGELSSPLKTKSPYEEVAEITKDCVSKVDSKGTNIERTTRPCNSVISQSIIECNELQSTASIISSPSLFSATNNGIATLINSEHVTIEKNLPCDCAQIQKTSFGMLQKHHEVDRIQIQMKSCEKEMVRNCDASVNNLKIFHSETVPLSIGSENYMNNALTSEYSRGHLRIQCSSPVSLAKVDSVVMASVNPVSCVDVSVNSQNRNKRGRKIEKGNILNHIQTFTTFSSTTSESRKNLSAVTVMPLAVDLHNITRATDNGHDIYSLETMGDHDMTSTCKILTTESEVSSATVSEGRTKKDLTWIGSILQQLPTCGLQPKRGSVAIPKKIYTYLGLEHIAAHEKTIAEDTQLKPATAIQTSQHSYNGLQSPLYVSSTSQLSLTNSQHSTPVVASLQNLTTLGGMNTQTHAANAEIKFITPRPTLMSCASNTVKSSMDVEFKTICSHKRPHTNSQCDGLTEESVRNHWHLSSHDNALPDHCIALSSYNGFSCDVDSLTPNIDAGVQTYNPELQPNNLCRSASETARISAKGRDILRSNDTTTDTEKADMKRLNHDNTTAGMAMPGVSAVTSAATLSAHCKDSFDARSSNNGSLLPCYTLSDRQNHGCQQIDIDKVKGQGYERMMEMNEDTQPIKRLRRMCSAIPIPLYASSPPGGDEVPAVFTGSASVGSVPPGPNLGGSPSGLGCFGVAPSVSGTLN